MKHSQSNFVQSLILAGVLFLFIGFPGATADAYNPLPYQWPDTNSFKFSINHSNFMLLNNQGLNLAENQYRSWILYALSQWNVQAGVDWEHSYLGDTNNIGCFSPALTYENTIDATDQCANNDPWCGVVAVDHAWRSGNNRVQSNICIYGGASNEWSVSGTGISSTALDLVSVLVHEFGHTLGLDHSVDTAVNSTVYPGSIQGRYLTGLDIEGMRSVFPGNAPVKRTRHWRERTGTNSWSSDVSFPGNNHWLAPSATIGSTSLGTRVVVAGVGSDGDRIHFTRAAYPLSSSSSWPNSFIMRDTWHSPSVQSSRPLSDNMIVAAWTNAQDRYGCGGIRIFRSNSAFTGGTVLNMSSLCTNHSPVLGYDDSSSRFILIYIERSGSGVQNRMVARTSVNGGVSWTAPQNLGISTLETPGLACNDKECMLKYMRASGNDPFVVTRRISVDSSGNINLHNWVQNNNRIQRSPLVGYSSSYADWMGGIVWYPTNGLRALGRGNIYTTATPSNPMTSFSWSFAAGQTYNSGSFATQGPFLKDYIFYIQ